jgi:hypothetical protein
VGAALGRRQLLRVQDALLRGDVPGAGASALEMVLAEPHRPEGFVALALVQEARGQRSRAILSAEIAISRALDGGETDPAGGTPAPRKKVAPRQPKPVPVEYHELLRRLERHPSEPGAPAR